MSMFSLYIPPTEESKIENSIRGKKSELTGFNGPESKLKKYPACLIVLPKLSPSTK